MFITFEGIEGAGKSTQIRLLAERLRAAGREVLTTREPGDGPLGGELRRLVLSPPDGTDIDERTELLIMLADRAQHVAAVIRPALAGGAVVVCDRYADSSVAYQGYARGVDRAFIASANRFATGDLTPDVTVLLDVAPEIGLGRQTERNRMEGEALVFHNKVRQGFLELASGEPERFVVVDASQAPEIVHSAIWTLLAPRLGL